MAEPGLGANVRPEWRLTVRKDMAMSDAAAKDGTTMEPTIKTTAKPKRTWWRRVLKWVVVVGVLLFVGVVIWGWYVTRQLRAEIIRIRDAGEPLTFKDLEAGWPKLEEDQDAGWFYNAGMALVRAKGVIEALEPYRAVATRPASQPSAEERERAQRILERNKLAFEMFDRGAALPFGRFSMDMQHGMAPSLERLATVRGAFKLLSLRTREAVRQGQADSALEAVVSSLGLLRVFRPQPAAVIHMSCVACRSLMLTDAQEVLNLDQLSEESLARLQLVVQESWVDNELERMILAERVYGMVLMRSDLMAVVDGQLALKLAEENGVPSMPAGSWLDPIPRQLNLGYLRDIDRMLQAARQPWPGILTAMSNPGLAHSTLGQLLAPSVTRSVILTGRSLAQVRSTAVAIMIRRYAIKHGKLPDTLAELVPAYTDALPADPFTGKSLIYKREPGGFVVYSVDEDLQDDGGRLERDKPEDRIDCGAYVRVSQRP